MLTECFAVCWYVYPQRKPSNRSSKISLCWRMTIWRIEWENCKTIDAMHGLSMVPAFAVDWSYNLVSQKSKFGRFGFTRNCQSVVPGSQNLPELMIFQQALILHRFDTIVKSNFENWDRLDFLKTSQIYLYRYSIETTLKKIFREKFKIFAL